MSQETPFYLQGNFAPVSEEITSFNLPVKGSIPEELRGLYLRNGPNPKDGDPGHWFTGDGMIHGVRLEDGEAKWYRNRWVQSRALVEGAQMIGPNGVDLTVAIANTNIVGHAGRIFALVEIAYPTEMTAELDTIGTTDFDGRLQTSMTAHPKECPRTGELHFFGYQFVPPYLTYHVLDASGALVKSEEISVPGPTMIHDFGLTDNYAIFMDLPIVFSPERAMSGNSFPYIWSDDYGARLGVMPRSGSNADVQWFEIDPCYVFHPMNAYDDGSKLVMDVVRYPELWKGNPDTFAPAHLHRWAVDLDAKKVIEQAIDDRSIEFPRVDPRRSGFKHRYGYAVHTDVPGGIDMRELVKYDLQTGNTEIHSFGPGTAPGEAVFVPAAGSAAEDDGYLLSYVYDAARDASDLVILNAAAIADEPVATIQLPQRVPFGFHGNWIADV